MLNTELTYIKNPQGLWFQGFQEKDPFNPIWGNFVGRIAAHKSITSFDCFKGCEFDVVDVARFVFDEGR